MDDLALAMKDPEGFIQLLRDKYKLKIKGDGPLSVHLGCNFFRVDDGTFAAGPKRCVQKVVENANGR